MIYSEYTPTDGYKLTTVSNIEWMGGMRMQLRAFTGCLNTNAIVLLKCNVVSRE